MHKIRKGDEDHSCGKIFSGDVNDFKRIRNQDQRI